MRFLAAYVRPAAAQQRAAAEPHQLLHAAADGLHVIGNLLDLSDQIPLGVHLMESAQKSTWPPRVSAHPTDDVAFPVGEMRCSAGTFRGSPTPSLLFMSSDCSILHPQLKSVGRLIRQLLHLPESHRTYSPGCWPMVHHATLRIPIAPSKPSIAAQACQSRAGPSARQDRRKLPCPRRVPRWPVWIHSCSPEHRGGRVRAGTSRMSPWRHAAAAAAAHG